MYAEPKDPANEGLDIRDNPLLDLFFGGDIVNATNDAVTPPATNKNKISPKNQQEPAATKNTSGKAQTHTLNMTLATFNIRNTPRMPFPQITQCGKILSGKFDIGGAQEIDTPQIEQVFHAALGDYKYTTQGSGDNPNYYTSDFRVLKHGIVTMTPAVHRPGWANPPRSFNWGEYQHDASLIRFMFVNTHMTNGAWNNTPKPDKEMRKELWLKEHQILSQYLTAFSQTLPVFIVGDLNRYSPVPKFVGRQMWIGDHTDDHIGYIAPAKPVQGPVKLTLGSEHHIKDPSDHLAVTRNVRMEVKW